MVQGNANNVWLIVNVLEVIYEDLILPSVGVAGERLVVQ